MEKASKNKVIKIAIVGPESSGKSTLAAFLAAQFQTIWVKEYARAYCEKLNRPCTIEDELAIFNGQIEAEDNAIELLTESNNSPSILICDTTILNVKVWCEHVFGYSPKEVNDACDTRAYDLYFLMKDDIPWEDDPLRNFQNERGYFFEVYQKELSNRNLNYQIIDGYFDQRNKLAKKYLTDYIAMLPL